MNRGEHGRVLGQSGRRRVVPFAVTLIAGWSIGGAEFFSVAAAADDRAVVLQEFAAGNDSFSLVIDPCRSGACPLRVWLHHGGRIVDRSTLDVNAASQNAQPETVDAVWGADTGLQAWATGTETNRVSTVARTATVAPGRTGLLVTQSFGFEHRKRGHVFLLPVGGKLVAAWRYAEGSGPTWSATEVLPGRLPGLQEIIVFRGFREPDATLPESLEAMRLGTDPSTDLLRETAVPDPARTLYLVRIGSYPSAEASRQARLANGYCLGAYWVLDGSRFPSIAGAREFLGRIVTRRDEAEAAARSAKECLPDGEPTVTPWTQGHRR